MPDLIVHLRAMQLFAHSAHNHVSRMVFFQDHEFFGDIYPKLETDYDDVTERSIGIFGELTANLPEIMNGVAQKLQAAPCCNVKQNSDFFQYQLALEKELCQLCKRHIITDSTEGMKQLLGEIYNKSESRQYLIQQRLKK